ncbi:MAG: hypothetical protein J7621_29635, partial [Niastella sp.]|nr:hypothetical protein [Niastella sp.]
LEVANGQVAVQVLGMDFYKVVDGHEVLVKGSAMRVLEVVQSLESSVQSKGIEAEREPGNESLIHMDTNQVTANTSVETAKEEMPIKDELQESGVRRFSAPNFIFKPPASLLL